MSSLANDPDLDHENPWPGLRPFDEADQHFFHGRHREANELFRRIHDNVTTIFFAKSGTGRTSLLRAGLFTLLLKSSYFPIYLRIDYSTPGNGLVGQITAALSDALTVYGVSGPIPASGEHLSTFLARSEFYDSQHRRVTPVLIFDQLEELFAFERSNQTAVTELYQELVTLASDTRLPASDKLYLFVSHVTEDAAAAMDIVTELERRGIRCWIAPRNVRAGHPFDDEIVDAIEASRAMLLIFSERCNASQYIRREVTVAGEFQKLIIPFRIEKAEPRRGLRIRLSDLHWIEGFVARERAMDTLIEQLNARQQADDGGTNQAKWRLVLSLREDWLPDLLERQLPPSMLSNRFRLRRLGKDQARDLIVRTGDHLVDSDAAQQIVEFLAQGRASSDKNRDQVSEVDAEIEPVLLSIICRELNNRRQMLGQTHISVELLNGISGSMPSIVGEFYDYAFSGLDPRLKHFIEDQLVTVDGFAVSRTIADALAVPGVSREAIDILVQRRVLRLEERQGTLWIGLIHDLIAQVISQRRSH